MKKLGFHHIALAVPNYEEVKNFYINGLGFKFVREWGTPEKTICMIDIGDGGCIELFNTGTSEESTNSEWLHFAFRSEDPDEAYAAAIKAGATPHTEPKDVDIQSDPVFPVRIAFVRGLAGELLEFFCEK